ncbi:MAG: PQQ-binding-like beta-propeller repeat protein [Pseudomonadales bacterium]|nr:PQQ-binding-like beta-propeller repeat protein [Pseudomonadales bacterium]
MKKPAVFLLFTLLAATPVLAQDIGAGAEAFNLTCAHCHGGNGQGGELGPSILQRVAQDDDAALITFLRQGNPLRGMPPAAVSDQQMPALVSYLRFLASTVADADFAAEDNLNQYASMPTIGNFVPVTQAMLENPSPNDWLMYSRTYDAQRHSPLAQINTGNVRQLGLAWSRGLPDGLTETIPTVYDGIMYLTLPGSSVAALDATTGDLIWQYEREYANPGAGGSGRSKTLAIFADMIYFTAPDASIVALDARTGAVRWETQADQRGHTSGAIVVEGKVISGGTCAGGLRANCYISAHDAYSGELLWKFYTSQAPNDPPGFDTWGGAPVNTRVASTWGLPGGYDPDTGLIYWGIANPTPNTRSARHGGNAAATGYSAPSDLYSNSTVTLDPDTGTLAWYYQHLPGDDWDEDMNQERIIFRTRIDPDPAQVKWINPDIRPGEERDVVVNIGEGGGLWVLDKHTGQFLWATPFPFDVDNFVLSDIDPRSGTTHINQELIVAEPGEHHIICYFNTRSYWPSSYFPEKNAVYVPYIRNCLNMTAAAPATETLPAMPESRIGIPEPGIDLDEMNGMARIDMESGEITHWPTGRIPTNSAVLTTAGNLLFWGDINRRYRALNADTGAVLWETILGAPISISNITYAVDGRQYVAVITGDNLSHPGLNTGTMGPIRLNLKSGTGANTLYVFALPE